MRRGRQEPAALVDLEAGRVDSPRPREEHLRGDRPDALVRLSCSEQLGESVRRDEAVVVHERDPLAPGNREPFGDTAREPELRRAADDDRTGEPSP